MSTETFEKDALFDRQSIYVSTETDKQAVLTEISGKLLAAKMVKPEFLDNLLIRERDYPTGIDLSVVSADLPNVAIPHTEGAFVNTRRVIPVKLTQPIAFANMINPEQSLQVNFLFMILNNDPVGQSNILAQIMEFLTATPADQLKKFFNYTDTDQIFDFLNQHFTHSK